MATAASRRETKPKLKSNTDLAGATAEAEARFVAANPKSRARAEVAARSMPGGNTRTVLHFSPFPLALAGGEGCHVTDIDGHRYADFLGEYTAGLYGHSNPKLAAAIKADDKEIPGAADLPASLSKTTDPTDPPDTLKTATARCISSIVPIEMRQYCCSNGGKSRPTSTPAVRRSSSRRGSRCRTRRTRRAS